MTIKFRFDEKYKSFEKGYEFELEGKLMIISGLNGSGKSHLLEYLKGDKSKDMLLRNVLFDNESLRPEMVIIKDVRDASDISHPNASGVNRHWLLEELYSVIKEKDAYLSMAKLQAFSINPDSYLGGSFGGGRGSSLKDVIAKYKSTLPEIKDAITNFIELDPNKGEISETEFKTIFQNSDLLLDDDVFLLQMDATFTDYLIAENDLEGKIWGEIRLIQADYASTKLTPEDRIIKEREVDDLTEQMKNFKNERAPWKKLNSLFEKLGFDYRFKEEYLLELAEGGKKKMSGKAELISTVDGKIYSGDFNFLSSGEKALVQLICASLTTKCDIKLLLLDEYDAVLNPSLIQIFYDVLKKYFIEKGIRVIIVTHSISTVAMAPKNATFYELNKPSGKERIIKIGSISGYQEFEKHLEKVKFADEIIEKVAKSKKPILLVEDKCQDIYQISWLKLKEIKFDKGKHGDIFKDKADFEIISAKGADSIEYFLRRYVAAGSKKIVALFDFDEKGFGVFYNKLAARYCWEGGEEKDEKLHGDRSGGLYLKNKNLACYAMLLPIPDRLKDYADKEFATRSCVEIENLLSDDFFTKCFDKESEWKKKSTGGGYRLDLEGGQKRQIRKLLFKTKKEDFKDFEAIFTRVQELMLQEVSGPDTGH
jgi:ABC-type multidrug transport system ATPase subunit